MKSILRKLKLSTSTLLTKIIFYGIIRILKNIVYIYQRSRHTYYLINKFMPFERGKTITELGIDTSRKFIVVEKYRPLSKGEILVLEHDDDSDCPKFKSVKTGECLYIHLSVLEYYVEEKRKFQIGDRVNTPNGKGTVWAFCDDKVGVKHDERGEEFHHLGCITEGTTCEDGYGYWYNEYHIVKLEEEAITEQRTREQQIRESELELYGLYRRKLYHDFMPPLGYNHYYYGSSSTTFDDETKACVDKHKQSIKTRMQKLTSTLKRVLNKDLRSAYEAGNINGGLELTDKGRNVLNAILLEKYEAELGEASRQELKDEKSK